MGTDIHLYKEKRVGGRWVTADVWEACAFRGETYRRVRPGTNFDERNYRLFDMLHAGARSETYSFSFVPRGIPPDLSPELRSEFATGEMPCEGLSYLYLHELRDLLPVLDAVTIPVEGYLASARLAALTVSLAAGQPDWHGLAEVRAYPASPDHLPFRFDVPAAHFAGDSLRRLIAGFDGIDGDNHRIVFYFET